ncbi:MAG: UTRA domain-containing protein, partial [Anaerolineaceae bacterium]|nr:UTRA domain-containing protein [Anaerolineaceae bacterium]
LISAGLISASKMLAGELEIEEGESLARIERLRLADGSPMSVEVSFLVHRYCPGILAQDYTSRSLRLMLEESYQIRITSARQRFRRSRLPKRWLKFWASTQGPRCCTSSAFRFRSLIFRWNICAFSTAATGIRSTLICAGKSPPFDEVFYPYSTKRKNAYCHALGEILIDMFPAEVGRPLTQVTAFHPKPGGAPANVAVAARRLGANTAFIGKVGDDIFGHQLIEVLRQEGGDTRHAHR